MIDRPGQALRPVKTVIIADSTTLPKRLSRSKRPKLGPSSFEQDDKPYHTNCKDGNGRGSGKNDDDDNDDDELVSDHIDHHEQQQQQHRQPPCYHYHLPLPLSSLPSLTDFIITDEEERELNKAAPASTWEEEEEEATAALSHDTNGDQYEYDPDPIDYFDQEGRGASSAGASSLGGSGEASSLSVLFDLSEDQDFVDALLSINDDDDDQRNIDNKLLTDGHKQLLNQSSHGQDAAVTTEQDQDPAATQDYTSSSSALPDIEIDFGCEPFLDDPTSFNTVFDDDDDDDDDENAHLGEEHQISQSVVIPTLSSSSFNDDNTLSYSQNTVELEQRGREIEEEEFLNRFVESLALNATGNQGEGEDITDTGFEADALLDELTKLNLFDDLPEGIENMDDDYDDDGLPPDVYPYCLPCNVQSTTNNNENAQASDSDERRQQQQLEATNDFTTANTGILTSIAEERPSVQRTKEEELAELQALYAASRRQQQQLKEPEFEEVGEDEKIQIDPDDPLVQDMRILLNDKEPEVPRWWEVAEVWCAGFGVDLHDVVGLSSDDGSCSGKPVTSEKICMGHKETIYGVTFSPDRKFMATSSQDSSVAIWEVAKHRLVTMLQGHSKAYECLRVDWAAFNWSNETLDREGQFRNVLASSGADGIVKVWSSPQPNDQNGWKCEYTLDHARLLNRGIRKGTTNDDDHENVVGDVSGTGEDEDKPQVYSLQFINQWKVFTDQMKRSSKHITNDDQNAFLMTSADEYIHLWEVEKHPFDQQLQNVDQQKIRILQDNEIKLKEVMSLHFGPIEQFGYGVTPCSLTGAGLQLPPPPVCSKHADVAADGQQATNFGGERNPLNIIYVFDASYCPASGLLGVALSDGSLRLINGRGTCVSILNLPGGNSHLTALAWDYTGSRLATTVATGHLITWGLDLTNEQGGREESIVATCLSIYEGGHQAMRPLFGARFVSSCGEDDQDEKLLISWGVDGRLCLWDSYAQGNIYAPIAVLKSDVQYPIYAVDVSGRHIAVGGGSDGGFIGNPMYLYEIPSS